MLRTGVVKCAENHIEKHGISLVVDHKKPRDWGGTNDRSDYGRYAKSATRERRLTSRPWQNVDADTMRKVTSHESVHVRIGELLKAVGVGKRTPSSLLEVVADQDDWQKRLRELRYPVIGWEIDTILHKSKSGKKQADYILKSFKPWAMNPTATIRQFERDRERRNREARLSAEETSHLRN